jgi:hypothetical protein
LVPSELAPLEDRAGMRLFAKAQEGATFEYMEQFMNDLVTLVNEETEGKESVISITSPGFGASSSTNSGFIRLQLLPATEREVSQMEVADHLGKAVGKLSGARVYVSQEPTIGEKFGGLPVQYVIQAATLDELKEILPQFVQTAQSSPAFGFVDVDLKFNKPEIQVQVHREKARALGISVQDISQTLQLAFSGQRFGYFIMNGKQYQVIGQVDRAFRDDPLDLRSLQVRNSRGEMIQLDNVVEISEESTPPQLFRYNRYASATVSASLNKGFTLGDGIAEMDRVADEVLTDKYSTALSGESKDFSESSSSLYFRVLPRLGAHLSHFGRAVRELPRPVHHHADGAAGRGGCHPFAVVFRDDIEHLQPDRHHHARGAGDQERHPYCRVRQPAQGGGPIAGRGHPRGIGVALPSYSYDQPQHHSRHTAYRLGIGRWFWQPRQYGHRHHWRIDLCRHPYAVRHPGHV